MKRKPTIDRNINKDVVLCETTNRIVSNKTVEILTRAAIPFTKNWKRVPFYKKKAYNGADNVCIIYINRNEYSKARRAIRGLEISDQKRLLLNVI